ncbi:MAG: ferritin [candidate division Zixibacteria bacterium]|nr:ferritin [candidate division Zixibacteria bacterium]
MLSRNMQEALNKQINSELYSAYYYMAMQAYFLENNLDGFAHWMDLQRAEETGHALKLFQYVYDREGKVSLAGVVKPQSNFKSALDVMQKSLEHERVVTKMIHRLYELAGREKDHATAVFLEWFVKEQVEEEKAALEIVQQMETFGDKGTSLFMMDRKLAERK